MSPRKMRQRRSYSQRQRRLFVEPLEARICLAAVPAFSSLPGADHTIYLDFDGHVTTGTTWNSNYGVSTIVSPAYDTNGDPSTYSAGELAVIEAAWKWVAEDFSPFNVNVTTVDPGAAALSYSGGGDTQWGTRVVITDDTFANCGCGGHAFLGSFDDPTDEPVFVYNTGLKGVSEASTHEVGHALTLSHDGNAGGTYYYGHGTGATSWAPLMGASYNRNVTQWSKGEYYTANQFQDDLVIISSLTNGNGFGYKADDHGDSNGAATVLSSAGGSISASGIIETTGDVDVLSFTTGAGTVSIDIDPAAVGPNLDIRADLYNSGGSLVATSNPSSVLDAAFNLTLAAGQYYIHIDGVGTGDPFSATPTGYTEYGSIGQYFVSGTVIDPGGLPTLSINDISVNEGDGTATFTVTLAGSVTTPVTVDFATAYNGSAASGSDYTSTGGSLSFLTAGTQTISVAIIDDTEVEGNETFVVDLSNAADATISDGQGVATITDNDANIFINDVSSNEGNLAKGKKNGGNPTTKDFVFTVTLSNPVSHTVTVNFATADGTATTATDDYVAASGLVTFNPGVTSQTVSVTVIGDNGQEGDEVFTVQLTSPQGASIADGTGTGTILEDDTKGGGGSGGGGNCNPNSPKCNSPVDEIEMQDPIWWFEGPSGEDGHLHDHLPLERNVALTGVVFVLANKGNAPNADPLLGNAKATSHPELIDRALADLELYTIPNSGQPSMERRAEADDVEADETSLRDDLIDAALDELVSELL